MTACGEITFDTIDDDEFDNYCMAGCYRLTGKDWRIFYFGHHRDGEPWKGDPIIIYEGAWPSGQIGTDAIYPVSQPLNKETTKELLSKILSLDVEWSEVRGPDSHTLK